MADRNDIDKLIAAAAERHGFVLDRNDPVLVTVTLHELAMERLLSQVEKTVETAKLEIAAGAQQQSEAAKLAASALITQAAEYADRQIRKTAEEAGKTVRKAFLEDLSDNPLIMDAERVSAAVTSARWNMTVAFLAASITALIAVTFPLLSAQAPLQPECPAPARQIVAQ